jgi:hypothetical protein
VKTDTSEPTDWRQLREFTAVDLDRSFVISWHIESGTLMIDVDLIEGLGHGVIEGLRRHPDGRYEIKGEFGTVFIAAERPLLRLKGP